MQVEILNLVKRYNAHFELNIPALTIGTGETFGLVGNNGAGKTTFLRLLLNLIRADGGVVRLDGEDVTGGNRWKIHTGSYLDESFLLDFLTADEFFQFVGTTYGMSGPAVASALGPYASFFTDRVLGERNRYVRELSMGNRKKVGLVSALFMNPRLLVLDEPFANLDPGSQLRLVAVLQSLARTHDATLIISSHDLGLITEVCARIAILDDGKIVGDMGTSEETLPQLRRYFANDEGRREEGKKGRREEGKKGRREEGEKGVRSRE